MSYLCGFCGKAAPNGQKRKVVRVQRPKSYPMVQDELGNWRTPQGTEIVSETPICVRCVETKKFNKDDIA